MPNLVGLILSLFGPNFRQSNIKRLPLHDVCIGEHEAKQFQGVSPYAGGKMKGVGFIHLLVLTFLTMSCTDLATQPEQHPASAVQASGLEGPEDLKSGPSGRKIGDHVPAQVLVKFSEGTEEQTIEDIQRELHLQTVQVISRPDLYLMNIQNSLSVEETIKRLQEFQAVEYAEPNYVRTIQ